MLALALWLGCATPTDVVPTPIDTPTPTPPPTVVPHPPVDVTPGPAVDAVTDRGIGRPPRRMTIDQLDASLRAVTGGIGWTQGANNRFVQLSATLGVPDYIERTEEDLEPGLLFQKFLEDAAGDVCAALVARERSAPSVFLTQAGVDAELPADEMAVRGTLADALLRFHGRAVDPTDPQLEPWFFLWESLRQVTGDGEATWRSTCVALITHPDFASY